MNIFDGFDGTSDDGNSSTEQPSVSQQGTLIHVDFRNGSTSGRNQQFNHHPPVTPQSRNDSKQQNSQTLTSSTAKPCDKRSCAQACTSTVSSQHTKKPVASLFWASEVCRILAITPNQLRSLDRTGLVSPSGHRKAKRAYTFQDLIAVRTALQLKQHQVRLRDISRAVNKLKQLLPTVTQPLSQLRVMFHGTQVVVCTDDGKFESSSGQMLLDFDIPSLRNQTVRMLRPKLSRQRTDSAYELYEQASKFDEDPETFAQALKLYQKAIALDPYLAIAYTNLGNIYFHQQNDTQAVQMYELALRIDPKQPEANYNLGYVMLEKSKPGDAIPYFLATIESDPIFADAYFNLAMAYENLGQPQMAQPHWKRYVQLQPQGTWSDIARKHL